MPFDPAPREVKVGKFQKFADALLDGCKVTDPIQGRYFDQLGGACALGGEEAIALLREKRCAAVLCNATFESYLREFKARKPLKRAPKTSHGKGASLK